MAVRGSSISTPTTPTAGTPRGRRLCSPRTPVLAVYQGDPANSEPVQLLQGRAKLTDALELLNTFQATTHFIGQHVVDFNEDGATGETHCLAYHLFEHNGQRMLMVMSGPLLRRKPGGDRTASAHRGMASVT
jgi:hypothetical protein